MNKSGSYERHFRKALSNHNSVLAIIDRFELELPYDGDESFPANWQLDPLLLFGQYQELLGFTEAEGDQYRIIAADLVESNGCEWVWCNRMRLAAQIEFIKKFEAYL
jgi:hypothetical protein